MADKLILNAGVKGLSEFDKLTNSLQKIKTSAIGSLGALSKKVTESANKIKGLGGSFVGLKSKMDTLKTSKPFQTINSGVDQVKSKIGGLKGAFGGLKGAITGLIATAGVFTFLKGSLDEYKGSLEAQTKLQANLQTVQVYKGNQAIIKQNLGLLQQQQSAIQKIGVYDDDLIAAGQAQLSTFQLTGKEVSSLMPKIADVVANQKGMNAEAGDFFNASNMIGKAVSSGLLAPLKRVGIAVDEATIEQFKHMTQTERVAKMNEVLEQNVGKVNEALAKTDLGRLKQGQNLWSNMKETVGQGVVKAIGALAPALYPLMDIVEKISTQGLDLLVAGIEKAKPIIDSIFKSFSNSGGIKALESLGNTMKSLFTEIGTSLGALFSGIDFGVVGTSLVKTIDELIKTITGAFQMMKPVLDPILFGLGKFITFISPILPILMKIIGFVLKIAMIFGMLANPITPLILTFSLIGLAISKIGPIWQSVVNFFTTSTQAISTFFVGIWQGISTFFSTIWNGFIGIVTTVWLTINAVVMTYVNNLKTIIQGIISVVTFVFNLVKSIITGNFTQASAMVGGAISGIISKIQGIINKVKEIGSAVLNAFNPKNWKVPNIKLPFIGKNYTGTENWRGGLTTVAERGAELIQTPGGSPFIAQKETMMNLPQGTIIKNARETSQIQKNNPLEKFKQKYFPEQTKGNSTTNNQNTTTTNNNTTSDTNSENKSFFKFEFNITNMSDIKNIEKTIEKIIERAAKRNNLSNMIASGEVV